MPHEIHVGKNVGLTLRNLQLIQQYMNKTRQNFSKTLNIILKEWDDLRTEIDRIKREQWDADVKKAKILKPKPGVEKK